MKRGWIGVLAAAGCVALGACSAGVAESNGESTPAACQTATSVGQLPAELFEASGMSRDPRRPDLFWIHNDSGNEARLFAVDATAAMAGITPIADATNRDVEDLATARCPEGWCLFYADIGDNLAVRPDIRIHRLPLPPLPTDAAVPSDPVRPLMSYTLVFPGGPRDAESLFVDADRGEIGIVTKGREGMVELYAADLETLESVDGPVALERVGRLDVPIGATTAQFVTGADLSPDGRRLAVRSYTTVYLWDWDGTATFDTLAPPATGNLIPAFEPQGEGITFTTDGSALYLASEGVEARPPTLSRIDCRP
jgi:hypothetical protein